MLILYRITYNLLNIIKLSFGKIVVVVIIFRSNRLDLLVRLEIKV